MEFLKARTAKQSPKTHVTEQISKDGRSGSKSAAGSSLSQVHVVRNGTARDSGKGAGRVLREDVFQRALAPKK